MRTADWTDSISVLDRVSAVLDAFGDEDAIGVSEIARRANLPKSTVSRIVADLVRQRYLDREGALLQLGLRLFELGQAVERPRLLRRLAHPLLLQVRNLSGESVRLAVRDGDDVVVIATLPGRDADAPGGAIGTRSALRATSLGRALLAHVPEVDGTAGDADRRAFAEIRRTGLVLQIDEPGGTACLASAVPAPGRPPTVSIGVAGPRDAVDSRSVGDIVRSAAATLGRRLASA